MTKRKMLAIIIALVLSVSLCACSAEKQTEANSPSKTGTFILVESEHINDTGVYQYIMYDPDTMVMYSYLDGYKGGGPTVLYNADGTLKLYSPSAEIE